MDWFKAFGFKRCKMRRERMRKLFAECGDSLKKMTQIDENLF